MNFPISAAAPLTGMNHSYPLAGRIAEERFSAINPVLFPQLRALPPERLTVVNGCYDRVERILQGLKIPHTAVEPEAVSDGLLERSVAVFVNSGNAFPLATAQRIARFVERGGVLITSDWALNNVLSAALPGFVSPNGRSTPEDVVPLDDVADLETHSPLTQDFRGQRPAWWLEANSKPLIRISPAVQVLLSSREMRKKYGNGSVAVFFPFGKGTVYHTVSHFYLRTSKNDGDTPKRLASEFAASWGVSERMLHGVRMAENCLPELGYSSLQAATLSTMLLLRILGKHATADEKKTEVASNTAIFQLLMGQPAVADGLHWPDAFEFDARSGERVFRFPRDRELAVIGRHGDVVILGDDTLKKRHVTIRRLAGDRKVFQLTAHGIVTIRRGEDTRTYDHGETAFLLPGDHVLLTPRVAFRFEPMV